MTICQQPTGELQTGLCIDKYKGDPLVFGWQMKSRFVAETGRKDDRLLNAATAVWEDHLIQLFLIQIWTIKYILKDFLHTPIFVLSLPTLILSSSYWVKSVFSELYDYVTLKRQDFYLQVCRSLYWQYVTYAQNALDRTCLLKVNKCLGQHINVSLKQGQY